MNNNNIVDAAKLRLEFYKDGQKKTLYLVIASIVFFVLSLILTVYSVNKEPDSVYFAVTKDKRLIKLIPLSKPNHKDSAVGNWLSGALVDTFDFSYYNIKSHLNKSTLRWFTDNGRKELLSALKNSGNFDAIINRKLIVSLSVDEVPLVIKKSKPTQGKRFYWKLQVPATITYLTNSNKYTNKVLFTITIARESLLSNPEGLGIHRVVMEKL